MTTIKLKEIYLINFNGAYKTKDTRYDVKVKLVKIIKRCIKYGVSFKVGYRNNDLIPNKNYIEITIDAFMATDEHIKNCNKMNAWIKGLKLEKLNKNGI